MGVCGRARLSRESADGRDLIDGCRRRRARQVTQDSSECDDGKAEVRSNAVLPVSANSTMAADVFIIVSVRYRASSTLNQQPGFRPQRRFARFA